MRRLLFVLLVMLLTPQFVLACKFALPSITTMQSMDLVVIGSVVQDNGPTVEVHIEQILQSKTNLSGQQLTIENPLFALDTNGATDCIGDGKGEQFIRGQRYLLAMNFDQSRMLWQVAFLPQDLHIVDDHVAIVDATNTLRLMSIAEIKQTFDHGSINWWPIAGIGIVIIGLAYLGWRRLAK